VGINDAKYVTNPTSGGKQVVCPYYNVWKSMMVRCYSPKFHDKNPSYRDCIVSKEWYSFMSFREWMISQDWKGRHLDKNIFLLNNKIYSKDTCCFVDSDLNKLFVNNKARRGKYPIGVSFYKPTKKYLSHISISGKHKHLGYFNTIEEASYMYRIAKSKIILDKANNIDDVRLKKALNKTADNIISDIAIEQQRLLAKRFKDILYKQNIKLNYTT